MIVVDASVALKWFVEEAGTPQAASLLDPAIIRFAPDLIVAEVCNAAWKSLRRGSMVRQQYATVADRLADLFTELVPSRLLAPRAAEIALLLDHPVYDAFYLALGEFRSARLITADRRLLDRVRGTPWADRVDDLHALPA